MSTIELFRSDDYSDGRTKQSFKDETDINRLLAKAARGESLSHLVKHGAVYGDFTDMDDLLTAQAKMARGVEIFMDLPGEIRREFNQSAGAFFAFVNDPANKDDLARLIPGLVERGTQLIPGDRTIPVTKREVVPEVVEEEPGELEVPPEEV